ncbi:MAG: hypothetical protein OHK93_005001 [Ramalina farinacea]|uniref:Uncharacterized protein n=1 Tax=Ramalina farinacea TaxID=258253 RepID=A0AA43QV82_9LECA|nr:hypothetical protein [Ramalina farinacea]
MPDHSQSRFSLSCLIIGLMFTVQCIIAQDASAQPTLSPDPGPAAVTEPAVEAAATTEPAPNAAATTEAAHSAAATLEPFPNAAATTQAAATAGASPSLISLDLSPIETPMSTLAEEVDRDMLGGIPSGIRSNSPSIYVVYPPVTMLNMCGDPLLSQQGVDPTTDSYDPRDVSSLQGVPGSTPTPEAFNFNDLPCPPPDIAQQLDNGSAYNPVFLPPLGSVGVSNIDCTVAYGIQDPPGAAMMVRTISVPQSSLKTEDKAQPIPVPAQPTPLPAQGFLPVATTPVSAAPSAEPTPAPIAAPPTPTPAPAPADPALLGGVASGVRSEIDGIPSSSPGCKTTEYVAIYPVNIWNPIPTDFHESLDTDAAAVRRCLLLAVGQPKHSLPLDRDRSTDGSPSTHIHVRNPSSSSSPTFHADINPATTSTDLSPLLPLRISPSIYVVYPPYTIYDLCGNTADPGLRYLSTLQAVPSASPVTQVFNFGDLPCPPEGIAQQLDPGAAYNPVLIAPFAIMHPVDDSNITLKCGVGDVRDPSRPVVRVNSITGPRVGPARGKRGGGGMMGWWGW